MAFQFYNANPAKKQVGDCVIRAISKVTEKEWDDTFLSLCIQGFMMHDMPSSNAVWGSFLVNKGFHKVIVPDTCPECYSIKEFCEDNPDGTFLLCTGSHVVAAIDGDYYDTWDSGDEVPIYFFVKEDEENAIV